MEVKVYFSNVGLTNFVEDLDVVKSHLEQIAKEDSRGVDLRRITVDGDIMNKRILGYKIIDYSVKEEGSIKKYELVKENYIPMSRLM